MDDKTKLLLIYGGYLLLLSLITFFTYGIDKGRAKKGKWRIKESVLLIMSILGGAFGGIIGMKAFRHKTSGEHWYFTAINLLGILIHLALIVLIIIKI